MKRTLLACLLSLLPCSLVALYALAARERGELKLSLARLEKRQRLLEDEVRELKAAEAQVLTTVRGLETRGRTVAERLQELQRQMPCAGEGNGSRLASSAELDEVVSAVNELVDVVDELSSRAEGQFPNVVFDGGVPSPSGENTLKWLRSSDGNVGWDFNTVAKRAILRQNRKLTAKILQTAGFSPDGKLLFTGGPGGKNRIWDVATGTLVDELAGVLEHQTDSNEASQSTAEGTEAPPPVILFPDSSSWSPGTPEGIDAIPAEKGSTGTEDAGGQS